MVFAVSGWMGVCLYLNRNTKTPKLNSGNCICARYRWMCIPSRLFQMYTRPNAGANKCERRVWALTLDDSLCLALLFFLSLSFRSVVFTVIATIIFYPSDTGKWHVHIWAYLYKVVFLKSKKAIVSFAHRDAISTRLMGYPFSKSIAFPLMASKSICRNCWREWENGRRVWWSTEATNISVYVVFRMVFPFQERSWNGFSNKNCHNENGAYNEKLKWMKYKYMILSFATFNRRLKMS